MGISLNFSENSRQRAEFYLEFGKKAEIFDKFKGKNKVLNLLNAVAHERNSKLKFRSLGSKRFASFSTLFLLNFRSTPKTHFVRCGYFAVAQYDKVI